MKILSLITHHHVVANPKTFGPLWNINEDVFLMQSESFLSPPQTATQRQLSRSRKVVNKYIVKIVHVTPVV